MNKFKVISEGYSSYSGGGINSFANVPQVRNDVITLIEADYYDIKDGELSFTVKTTGNPVVYQTVATFARGHWKSVIREYDTFSK